MVSIESGRNPERWVIYMGVGGYVCAVPDATGPDGICGMPVETEPCDKHTTPRTGPPRSGR